MADSDKEDIDIEKKPEATIGDAMHTIAKAGLSGVPVLGGPAAELFSAVLVPPLSRRRDRWIQSIAERLKRLEEKVQGLRIEELAKNEMFVTTVMHASQVAIRNHQEEKLEALGNAVLNSALPNAPQEDKQLMFLNFVDSLTPWHLNVLKFFENPRRWLEERSKSVDLGRIKRPAHLLESALPQHKGERGFNNQIINDLFSKGLLQVDASHTLTRHLEPLITPLAEEFLSFVTSPVRGDEESPKGEIA